MPQIAQGVYLDMAALLSLKGTQINGNDASLKFNPYYLEIPIHMGYKYAINDNFAIFGNFGPYFAVGLFGKMKATGYLIDEVEGLTSIHDSAKVFGSNAMKRLTLVSDSKQESNSFKNIKSLSDMTGDYWTI